MSNTCQDCVVSADDENRADLQEVVFRDRSLASHAWREFRALGWVNEQDEFYDDMQEDICQHVLRLLEVFSDEDHSGSSAPYAINLFSKLAKFEPLGPLTGKDFEWTKVGDDVWQNNRCSHVFKNSEKAWDIDGIIFREKYVDPNGEVSWGYFTNGNSRVEVTFPYNPVSQYVEVERDAQEIAEQKLKKDLEDTK